MWLVCVAIAVLLVPVAPASARTIAAEPTPWPGGRWQPDAAAYGMTVVSDVPVTMDDGTILHANIGYPTDRATGARAAGTYPVLLTQNPYAGPSEQPDPFYVTRGYIFVSVEVRGTLNSEAANGGPLVNELFGPRQTRDGVALVDWAAHHLGGSNGVIGLTGCSQLGINQLFTGAAVGRRSPVKAMVPACASNGYDIYFAGGIPGPTLGLFGSSLAGVISGTKHLAENTAFDLVVKNDVVAGGPLAYNGEFWQERTTSAAIAQRIVNDAIPTLLWSGWNAPDGTGATELYTALQNASAGRPAAGPMSPRQRASGRYQIVVGPWGHGQGLDESIQLEWYDTWLKGERTGINDTRTPMHLFDTGADEWVNVATNPIASRSTPLYLGADGALVDARDHRSGWHRSESSSDTIAWGQPTEAGTTLTYTSAPYRSGATLAGPISATIYARSSNQNLELLSTLEDVGPDGTASRITSGTILGSLRALDLRQSWFDRTGSLVLPRHLYRADVAVPTGRTVRYDVKLDPTVRTLEPGHSLRLTLSTQQPASDCASLLTALEPAKPCLLTAPQQASLPGGVYRIERSGLAASRLNLPIVPAGSLPVATSGTTPTSNGVTLPLDWSSTPPR